jgi:predicted ATP-dependent protease
MTIFFLGQVVSVDSFMPINSKRCIAENCGIDKYIEPTPKLKKIIRDLLKKSEKIKNILVYPEPEDKEDWESGEIPWEPKNETVVEIYEVKNKTSSELRDETNTLSSYNLGMLFI